MARPAGVRNSDFNQKKLSLLEKLTEYLLRDGVYVPSLRQLAIAAETSEPTLRHYFGDRSGLIVAVLEHIGKTDEPILTSLREPQESCEGALNGFMQYLQRFRAHRNYSKIQALGIRESLADEDVQSAYLQKLVRPGVEVLTERFLRSRGGPATFTEARSAATMTISASIFMVLHQDVLNGKEHMPIDHETYLEHVGQMFLKGIENCS